MERNSVMSAMHKNTICLIVLCVLTNDICLEAKKKKTVQQELLDLLKYIVRNRNDWTDRTDQGDEATFTDLTRYHGHQLRNGKNNYKNKILVKRIIPHKINELNEGNKRRYRPLFKIHNVPIANDILQNIINYRTVNDAPKEGLGIRGDIDNVKIFKIVEERSHDSPRIGYRESRDDVLRHWTEAEMAEALEGLQVVPGHRPDGDNLLPWNTKYPHWNYWTYYKTIYQDPCPDQQIKVGNICVRTPQH